MMRIKLMIAVTGVAIGFSMLGCSNNLQTENTLLKKENEELRAQYKESSGALQAADDDLRRTQDDLRAAEEVSAGLQEAIDTRPETISIFENINGVDVTLRD